MNMHFEELDMLHPFNAITNRIETPTPHKVAVLILVDQYIRAKRAISTESGQEYPALLRRNFCMLLLKLIQYPDMTYADLYQLLCSHKYKLSDEHLANFEKVMDNLFSLGIETLFDFCEMQNIEKMLAEELGVSQFSIVGLYIRRVGVILERLSFSEMVALHKSICLYYDRGVRSDIKLLNKIHYPLSLQRSRMLTEGNCDVDNDNNNDDITKKNASDAVDIEPTDRNPYSKWSTKQVELFVRQQSYLLEYNEIKALPPKEMQNKINEIMRDNPLNSPTYFLDYMNQMRLRDVFGAKNALHRAFDRCPLQMLNGSSGGQNNQTDQKGYQYFCLNLAIFHANFGHRRKALHALKECIMLAQDNGDKHCLDLANSWYCLINSRTVNVLDKSLPDMQDPGLIQSLSSAILFVVKLGAQSGYMPIDLFEMLLKSDEINSKHTAMDHVSDSLALRSALWCLYGRYEMSSLYAQMLINLDTSWVFGKLDNSENVCKALSSLSLWLSVQGEPQLSAVLLDHARIRFPRYPHAANWMISQCIVSIQQAIYSQQWQVAMKWCCQLHLLNPNDGVLQKANVYVARGDYHAARRILRYLEKSLSHHDVLIHVRLLILLAYTGLIPEQVSAGTIDLLMRASILAASFHMEYEHALIDIIMAYALLEMSLPGKALQALNNSKHIIYINGGLYDRSKTDFLYVRCIVAASVARTEQISSLQKSISLLERAIDGFHKLGVHAKVLDVYVYIMKTFNEFDLIELRNKYAYKFQQYYTEHPVAREYLGMPY